MVRSGGAAAALVLTGAIIGVLWALVLIDALLDHRLLRFGIKPRSVDGLFGIVVSPFLHVNAAHMFANTVPLVVLGFVLLLAGIRQFLIVTAAVMLGGGVIDWLAGPSHATIVGASGVVFGWLGYLLARAWFGRRVKWIAIALVLLALFSSMFTGLLPTVGDDVFWGGHVAGFAVGVAVAAALHRKPKRSPKPTSAIGGTGPAIPGSSVPSGD